ncbi:hypothetical protein NC661_11940 [Aquibacillus koreensis]|uniref:Uncharacterized protein n=1 Tax=Aquibacillus koreensis TaxID=279446 RepID=A0A9X3WLR4_9BACI|nr:hypothetical protein [Aquibacillus koreensis]MCT2535221.1 hypothetical protein [Aquibacillus koreensis]MDC3421080.1 hypothetical protein [Aquibacillus koreensis]
MAPKCETCRLVATTKIEEDIHLTVLHNEEGFVYFKLSETDNQRNDIKAYIKDLQPKILSGVYQSELVDMTKEEICC